MKLILVVGARPNFMKIAPIMRAIKKYNSESQIKNYKFKNKNSEINPILVHTGQHYDDNMSQDFFNNLGIKKPNYNLAVGSGSHTQQTANVMIEFEKICIIEKPDLVLVVGDVNSTIAAALVAKKMNIKLIHVEAGLRSYDISMPEEINRIATDAITDIFFTTEPEGTNNLTREGHDISNIHFVGHVMIDNLLYQLNKNIEISSDILKLKLHLTNKKYICMTMHRPSNVDNKEKLKRLLKTINDLSFKHHIPVIFPCHPRTKQKIQEYDLIDYFNIISNETQKKSSDEDLTPNGITLLEPLSYNDFLYLWKDSLCVFTDSGGLQEETTALQIPCITMRENTERPITCTIGTNMLVGSDKIKLTNSFESILSGIKSKGKIPKLWDGNAAERIINIIANQDILKKEQETNQKSKD